MVEGLGVVLVGSFNKIACCGPVVVLLVQALNPKSSTNLMP